MADCAVVEAAQVSWEGTVVVTVKDRIVMSFGMDINHSEHCRMVVGMLVYEFKDTYLHDCEQGKVIS